MNKVLSIFVIGLVALLTAGCGEEEKPPCDFADADPLRESEVLQVLEEHPSSGMQKIAVKSSACNLEGEFVVAMDFAAIDLQLAPKTRVFLSPKFPHNPGNKNFEDQPIVVVSRDPRYSPATLLALPSKATVASPSGIGYLFEEAHCGEKSKCAEAVADPLQTAKVIGIGEAIPYSGQHPVFLVGVNCDLEGRIACARAFAANRLHLQAGDRVTTELIASRSSSSEEFDEKQARRLVMRDERFLPIAAIPRTPPRSPIYGAAEPEETQHQNWPPPNLKVTLEPDSEKESDE